MKRIFILSFAKIILVLLTNFPLAVHAQTVTFDEILKDPDNIQLNLQYARQEISAGRLQQAASALERLLLNRPNWDSIRLLYGTVLFRLDDIQGAKREFLLLEGRQLSQKQEAARISFLKKIDQASSGIRISGQISLGGRYDSNPGLVSDRIANAVVNPGLGPGTNLTAPVAGMFDEEDNAWVGAGRLRVERDLSSLPGSYLFLQADGNLVDFSDIDRSDVLAGSLKAGVTLTEDRLKVSPYVKLTSTSLQSVEFNRRWGAGVAVQYRVSPRLSVFATGEYLDEDFFNTSFSANNSQRSGDLLTGLAGFTYRLNEKNSITLSGLAADKNSDINQGYSYTRYGMQLSSLSLLGKGMYLSLTGKYTATDYDRPDGVFNSPFQTITRRDERLFARASLGVPLQTISDSLFMGRKLPKFLRNVVMQAGISWTDLSSSSPLVEYDNWSADILFKKKFAF